MYKILVVDDESLIREDIVYKIGTSNFPVTWLMEAASGEEALEIVREHYPDIMLADIKMDGMNGLQLAEKAGQIAPGMAIIMISGYSDFAFAQSAIRLGVQNYLLKPVKAAELAKALSQAAARLRQAQEQRGLSAANYVLTQRCENYQLRAMVNGSINEGFCQSTGESQSLLPQDAVWFQLWNIRMVEREISIDRDTGGGYILYGACNIIREIGDATRPGCLLPVEKAGVGYSVVVLAAAFEEKEEDAEKRMLALAGRLRHLLEQSLGIQAAVSVSGLSRSLSTASTVEADRAMDVRFFYEKTNIPVLSYRQFAAKSDHTVFDNIMRLFREALNGGSLSGALDAVSMLAAKCREAPVLGLRDTYTDMVRLLSRACYRKGRSILSLLGGENLSGSILDTFEAIEEVEENLRRIVTAAMRDWMQQEDTTGILEQVRRYIDDRFMESSLSTAELAKHFCISSGYLSALFTKTYGIPITKYITRRRMEYAAGLLRQTATSLETIAELCGFNSFSYFMRVFKTNYGVTPSQFRNGEEGGAS